MNQQTKEQRVNMFMQFSDHFRLIVTNSNEWLLNSIEFDRRDRNYSILLLCLSYLSNTNEEIPFFLKY